MARFTLLAAMIALASGFQAPASSLRSSAVAARPAAQVYRAPVDVVMSEPSDKAVTIGAAAVGGILGVYVFHELSTAVVLSLIFAYGSTYSNGFGEATKTAGGFAAKAYGKTLEINEQYDVLPKAKGAADTVVTAAANLDANYGITAKIDEQLKLTEAIDSATAKIEEVKGSVTSKVDDLKSKASSS